MKNEAVRIIITARNNEDIIKDCLKNILNQSYVNIRITVIDDASSDNTLAVIKNAYPEIDILANEAPNGPAKNRNVAASRCSENWILFLDSDAFPEKNWIRNAFEIIDKDDKIGIVGGKIYFPKNKQTLEKGNIQCVGGFMYVGGLIGAYKSPDIDLREYIWLPSSTFMVNREAFKRIGGFDEDFFYLIEDNDLCWRMIIAGYKVIYSQNLVSIHKLSITAKSIFKDYKISYLTKRNKMLMLLKNYEGKTLFFHFFQIVLTVILEAIFLKNRLAVLWGNISAFLMLKNVLKKRKEIKKYRKVFDDNIIKKLIITNIFKTFKIIRKDGYV